MIERHDNELHCGDDWLVAYADNELTGYDCEQAEQHLTGCARCRQECAALRTSLQQVQEHWQSPIASVTQQRRAPRGRSAVLLRAAIVVAILLTLAWKLVPNGNQPLALVPTIAPPSEANIDDWLQRETQIARLRAASALIAREPGMQERGEQLEQYRARTYGN